MLPITGLQDDEQDVLNELVMCWRLKLARNMLRTTYFDTKNILQDLRISLPPQLANAEAMMSWPAKAVHSLAARAQFDGFVSSGAEQDPFALGQVLEDNCWDVELPQALVSSLVHAVSFVSVTKGDVAAGEPEVLVLARSARHGAVLWDRRRRGVKAALAIADTDPHSGEPTEVVLYMADRVITAVRSAGSTWALDRRVNPTGRVLVTPLVFKPELDRPFGHSRITRAVMQLTDAAVRTFVRAEVGAEFYATPQRYILGADPESFSGEQAQQWRALSSRFLGIGKDEDGDIPTVSQFPQMSMLPHTDQLRMIAELFAAETNLPVSSLGIVQDNPASAEAIYAAKEDLVMEVNAATRVWGAGLRQIATNIVMVRDNLSEPPTELSGLRAKWQNPATPSIVSASDAFVKQASVMPWLADSEVGLELLGYDEATRTRLMSDKRRYDAKQSSQSLGLAAGVLARQNAQPATQDTQGVPGGDGSTSQPAPGQPQ